MLNFLDHKLAAIASARLVWVMERIRDPLPPAVSIMPG
jgi:hypothetical protein